MWPDDHFEPSRPIDELASAAIARGRQLRRRRKLVRRIGPAAVVAVLAAVLPMVLASGNGGGTEVRTTGESDQPTGRREATAPPAEDAGGMQAPSRPGTTAVDTPTEPRGRRQAGGGGGEGQPPDDGPVPAEGGDSPLLRPADRIAFIGTVDAGTDVITAFADGSGVRRLTTAPGNDFWPSWAPDGRRIAFYSDRDGTNQVYVVGAEGGAARRLTSFAGDQATQPAWSPDGERIAFTRFQRLVAQTSVGGVTEKGIWSVGVDGSGARQLTTEGAQPAWSPEGRRLAYVTPAELRVLDLVTGSVVVIARSANAPSWSPDGGRIAFARVVDGKEQLFVVNADGSAERRLVASAANDSLPSWAPDGTSIVFTRDPDGRPGSVDCEYFETGRCAAGGTQPQGLWVVSADGTNARALFPATVRGDYGARVAPRG